MKRIFFFTILCLIASIFNGYLFNWLNNNFFHYSINKSIDHFGKPEKSILALLISPIIETLLFQYIPNLILLKMKISNKYLLIIIPSIFFGLSHTYHFLYAIMAFCGGMILNYYYLEMKRKTRYYYWATALIHSLYNLYGLLFIK
ncbi:MAG: CPBP family intramembrane metalloprotease [Chitinophagaceae bacterium]|nr:CPBP family intramembrane metalloprotease [Chitinophagaceae bacterium]